jgi:hypothetical protein
MIKRGKLTKRFLMELNSGDYLMSNVCFERGVPVYDNWVQPFKLREEQWKAIVHLAADQRLCYVFSNKEAAEKWQAEIGPIEK